MPSRFVRSCPGCAISAGTRALFDSADRETVERDRRGARAPIRGIDRDRVGQHFQWQSGRLGGLLGEHDRARAGIEHEGNARAVDLGDDREISAGAAREFHRAPAGRGVARHQLGHDTVGNGAQLEAIGVSDRQQESDHDPDGGGFERLRESLAEESQSERADEEENHGLDDERGKVEAAQACNRAVVRLQRKREHHGREDGKQQPEKTAHPVALR